MKNAPAATHAAWLANYLCDKLGLDTISAGVVIGWTIECFQKRILTRQEIGREIDFSDLDSDWYYSSRGWNENGIPTKATLLHAGLSEVVAGF